MKTTQCARVLRHLTDFRTITQLEAMRDYGIMRLASRISDLKRQGYPIVSETKTGRNRYGEPTRWKVYRLER